MSKTDAVRAKIGKRIQFNIPKRLLKKGQPFAGYERGSFTGTLKSVDVQGRVATAEVELPKKVGGETVTIRVADIQV